MLLHAHNSFTPNPAENKTNVAGTARVLENRTVTGKRYCRAFLFFFRSPCTRAGEEGDQSFQFKGVKSVRVENEKEKEGRREGTRGRAIKEPGEEKELMKMLVPPSLGIFNYAKLPRDINNAG